MCEHPYKEVHSLVMLMLRYCSYRLTPLLLVLRKTKVVYNPSFQSFF